MAGLDRETLFTLFDALGRHLLEPATICLIGSVPGIANGQPERSTQDVDVWAPKSDFDISDFRKACEKAGLLFDPRGEMDAGAVYIQIVRPGIVQMPADFAIEPIGRFGRLTVTMPRPSVLCASKLVRASDVDVEDIVWWLNHADVTNEDVATAVGELPERAGNLAKENLVLLAFLSGRRET